MSLRVRSLGVFVALGVIAVAITAGFAAAASADTPVPVPSATLSQLATAADQPASQAPVVRELVEERTLTSKTYLLADGSLRSEFFETPIHYLDENAVWQDIDTSLIPAPTSLADVLSLNAFPTPSGDYVSAATPIDVTIASEAPGQQPVTLEYDNAVIKFNLIKWNETDLSVTGDEATYADVATATDVSYQVLADGLKETIALGSAAAPNSFRYFVSHPGTELRQSNTGQWGFYRSGEAAPVFQLSDVLVFDSSVSATGDHAICDAAQMTVTPTTGGDYVTYTVPRAWLSDPARTYPVMIDPTTTLGQTYCHDTYISDATKSTPYGTSTELRAGYYAGAGFDIGLIKFDLGSLMNPDAPYVTSADLRIRQSAVSGTQSHALTVLAATTAWSDSSTWNSFDGTAHSSLTSPPMTRRCPTHRAGSINLAAVSPTRG